MQRYYGTTLDGVINDPPKKATTRNISSIQFGTGGSALVRALQKDLGTKIDVIISNPLMIMRALQKRLGMLQDGKDSNLQ